VCLGRNLRRVGIFLTVERAHLTLAIEIDSDPISGSVSHGPGISRPFRGWIELAGVIEAARSAGGLGDNPAETLGSFPGANGSAL
jgi:hypothetical protein